ELDEAFGLAIGGRTAQRREWKPPDYDGDFALLCLSFAKPDARDLRVREDRGGYLLGIERARLVPCDRFRCDGGLVCGSVGQERVARDVPDGEDLGNVRAHPSVHGYALGASLHTRRVERESRNVRA